MKNICYLAYRGFALNSCFIILISGFSSPTYSKCMVSGNFQICVDETGNISSISSLPANATFPEASEGGSELHKKLKAIQGPRNLRSKKTRAQDTDRPSQNDHDITNCILGPMGSTC